MTPTAELTFRRQTWRRPYRILHALCTDGKRRNVTITSEPTGTGVSTGFVSVKSKSVTGILLENKATGDWSFTATTGRNAHLLP